MEDMSMPRLMADTALERMGLEPMNQQDRSDQLDNQPEMKVRHCQLGTPCLQDKHQ